MFNYWTSLLFISYHAVFEGCNYCIKQLLFNQVKDSYKLYFIRIVLFYKVWFIKLAIFLKTELIKSEFLQYFHSFFHKLVSWIKNSRKVR